MNMVSMQKLLPNLFKILSTSTFLFFLIQEFNYYLIFSETVDMNGKRQICEF